MPVEIRLSAPGCEGSIVTRLEAAAVVVLASLERSSDELSIAVVEDVEMRMLNRDYRGHDQPTDVLAFSLERRPGEPRGGSTRVGSNGGELLGDVVISLETARRQARAGGWELEEELHRLLVHGVLHLLGFDHETSREQRERMQREERRLARVLQAEGLGCAIEELE